VTARPVAMLGPGGRPGVWFDEDDVLLVVALVRSRLDQLSALGAPVPTKLVLLRGDMTAALETCGSVDGTVSQDDGSVGRLLDTEEAGELLGIGAPAVAKRARRGRIPGARQVGRTWLIPATYVAERLATRSAHHDHRDESRSAA